jgi:archaellum component FlaF (FlaF/FlaG flagellin family)
MEHAIPSMIIGTLLLLASAFTAQSSLGVYDDLSQTLKVMESRLGEQSRTRTAIVSATLDANGHTLTVTLLNEGQTRLTDYARFDVIAGYHTVAGFENGWLAYVEGAPAAGSWTLTSIDDDEFEPGLLNPGETATLQIELIANVEAGHTNRITIVSESGVAATATFAS